MNKELEKLEPQLVWQYFAQICDVPRPSGKEEQIRQFLINTAQSLGLVYKVTSIGNIVIQKPATPGMENCKKITLQVHMDMVTAKLRDLVHDFTRDAIKPYIDGDWVRAKGTTLGADNGIGVAYGLAILTATDLVHGDLELLVTSDEEVGMTGAFGLNAGDIDGDILLNLDSEEDEEVCIGCAGGINTEISLPLNWVNYDIADKLALKVVLDGLYSGHSGVDIHLGRANAIKELAGFLYTVAQHIPVELCHISGGRLRNVIPAYCEAVIVISSADLAQLEELRQEYLANLVIEYQLTEKNMRLTVTPDELPAQIIAPPITRQVISALHACFNGLWQMNWALNIPQTSSNIGVVKIVDNHLQIITLQRSASNAAKIKLAARIGSIFELIGAKVSYEGDYPGWLPNLSSEMLGIVESCYEELFAHKIKVSATHGGLECGLILSKFPYMDAVSIGATVRDPHSVNERVNIQSVAKIWRLITKILAMTPKVG